MAKASKSAGKPVSVRAAAPGLASETVTRTTVILFFAIVLGLTFVAYLPALRGPFLFDDLALPYGQPNAQTAPFGSFLTGVRPLLYSLFWLETRIWGTSPLGYHFVNIAFHCLNGLLVGWLVWRILGAAGETGRAKAVLTGIAVTVFLLHPLQTEAVAYVASRSENMSVFFFFAAAVFYMRGSVAGVTWLRAAGVLLLWGFALGTKEHVFVLPAFLALTDFYWNPGFTLQGIKRNWRLYILFPLLAAAGIIMVRRALGDAATVGFNLPGITWWQYFLTQCKALWIYLRLLIVPLGQNLDHGFPVVQSAADPVAWIGFLGLTAAAVLAWIQRRKYPLASYGYFVFLVQMAPTSSFLPIMDALAERRLYLAFAGVLFLMLELLRRWRERVGLLAGAGCAAGLLLAILTFQRNGVYASDIAMWEDSVAGNPRNDRSFFQLGYAYYRDGRCADAVRGYEQVARLRAPDYMLQLDWALALDCAGQTDAAEAKIKQAIATRRTAHALAVLGMIQGKAGKYEQAIQTLREAEQTDPSFVMTYNYRGTIYFNMRQYGDAVTAFRKALTIDPNNAEALRKLSQAEAAARQ
ncbi:MAG: tetratricopeptide repeat protein [Bryobacterales bacterium]|nr:tetratricopeptide repeat protein [Bryobacterales bacterium]